MTYRVELSPRAIRDLEAIFLEIQAQTTSAAAAWFSRLVTHIESLSEMPERGSVTKEDSDCRQPLFGHKPRVYRIIYEVDTARKTIGVLHIRHGAKAPFR